MFHQSSLIRNLLTCLLFNTLVTAVASAATLVVHPGEDLQEVFRQASPGDVIQLERGTYPVSGDERWFHVNKSLTIESVGGVATLQPREGAQYGLVIAAGHTTIDTLNIASAGFGIVVRSRRRIPVSDVALRNVTIQPATTGHGILFEGVGHSRIENCTVMQAYDNGIMLDAGSNDNLVANNVIHKTIKQHGITVKNSNSNTLAGNIIQNSGFHGILLHGASGNRVERNVISGQSFDGITLDRSEAGHLSQNNYVGQNTITRNTQQAGTGIWLTDNTTGTYIFGNRETGAFEGCFSGFNSSDNYLLGNVGEGCGQAGILLWNEYHDVPAPTDNALVQNFLSDIVANGAIFLRGAAHVYVADNFLADSFAGLQVTSWDDENGRSGGSSEVTAFDNTMLKLTAGFYVGADTKGMQVFRNRTLHTSQNFSASGAGISWDGGRAVGGNYWSDSPGGRRYSSFITNPKTGERSGQYEDHFPDKHEAVSGGYSMTVMEPERDVIIAQGSQKTIAWRSEGCVLVDISYSDGTEEVTPIATNYPDVGIYQWTVGTGLSVGSNYKVRVDCKNSRGMGTGASGTSSAFTVGTDRLVMLTPGPGMTANAGQNIWVAWKVADAAPVDIYVRHDGGEWSRLASHVRETSATVTLPNVNSNQVQLKIQESDDPSAEDGVDEQFSVRMNSPGFTFPASGNMQIGSFEKLRWISPQNSVLVDLSFMNTAKQELRPIFSNLPDRGEFGFGVPGECVQDSYLQATFKDASGKVLSSVRSGAVSFVGRHQRSACGKAR